MTGYAFKSVIGKNIPNFLPFVTNNLSNFCISETLHSCRNFSGSLSLKNQENSEISPRIYGCFVYNDNVLKEKNRCSFYPSIASRSRYVHRSLHSSAGVADLEGVISENDGRKKEDFSKEGVSSGKILKMISGSCCLPHPDKRKTGGEDAHFICEDEQAIGVADGVGGWAEEGIDAGKYSRELMSNSAKAIKAIHKLDSSLNLTGILKEAHSKTNSLGSSTACIIALGDQNLHAINLGDSGFLVIRDGSILFSSPVQQHDFNFPYQLQRGNYSDPPSSAQVFRLSVAPGDVIVAGTDGLFDNLFNKNIVELVVDAVKAGLPPCKTAQKIADAAEKVALNEHHETPFSLTSRRAGYDFPGGKPDDITVVVSYVTNCAHNHELQSAS